MKIREILDKKNDELIIALSYLIDKSKSFIYLNPDLELNNEVSNKIVEIENKINDGEPLQYALGRWEFYGLDLIVDNRALIPRFETEILVDYILKSDIKKETILDIGTGSGAISLSLAKNLENSDIIGVDIENNALSLANENKEKLNLKNVKFLKSDLFSNINTKFDLIVSNPPYISEADYKCLDKQLFFEPKSALVGGEDGLDFYKQIIKEAPKYLNEDGHIVFEIGYDQKVAINDLLIKSDFKNIENIKDFNGFDRIIIAKKG
ncbi:peptide chain release factor N(5)-glutamine methyltransferase [Anaerococcus sp. mt242]|uniref:peptide chain release factor N(5)-glutamine methyltransferase n=1 Tax=Anaerococcus sp. mt242 TaxID=2661917 RepID=UPI0019322F03|nr:peptide chain release factor N(5)-glutamine methyltransferase [Anaerococcus sp. mt242]MBM0045842.1 peptide chain release factor N(5)-glutamine methyltransferase [Anaerococcus sp. mt242]